MPSVRFVRRALTPESLLARKGENGELIKYGA
jgi:hypothetical protein